MAFKKAAPAKKAAEKKSAPEKPATRKAAPSGKSSWFSRGIGATEKETARQADVREALSRSRRLFIPPATGQKKEVTKRVIYLDESLDDMFNVKEHGYFYKKGSGKPPVFKTCLDQEGGECPHDEGGNKGSFTSFLSIINTSSWTDKNNKEHSNNKELHPFKVDQFALFRRAVEKASKGKKAKLRGMVFDVVRLQGDKSHPTGDTFEYVETLDLRNPKDLAKYNLKGVDLKPIDYMTDLAPQDWEAAEAWLKTSGFGGGGSGKKEQEEEVPY